MGSCQRVSIADARQGDQKTRVRPTGIENKTHHRLVGVDGPIELFPPEELVSMDWILGILVDPPTRMIWSTLLLLIPASLSTWVTGIMVFLNRSPLSSSNLAREMVDDKSCPPASASHSTAADVWCDSVRLAFSHCLRRRCTARLSPATSIPVRRLNCAMK